MKLSQSGFSTIRTQTSEAILEALREEVFRTEAAGTRCLLDVPLVREVAVILREQLVADEVLLADAPAIQAIAFDKTSTTNWKVTWHQDVMYPFRGPVRTKGFDLPVIKAGVAYARPPREVLEDLVAVRLHLDLCDATNGSLQVSPGSHRQGVLGSSEIPDCVRRHGEAVCLARPGEALLMKPLLLHASSRAREPRHRRVLHIVYHSGAPIPEPWHRAV